MKKKISLIIAAIILSLAFAFPALAEGIYVVDDAGLLSENQESFLTSKFEAISSRQGCDVVFMTTDDTGEYDVATYADLFTQREEYGEDVVLLMLDMQHRKMYISTKGACIGMFTDAGLEYIFDNIQDYATARDYSGMAEKFAGLADEFIAQAKTGKPYDTGYMPGDVQPGPEPSEGGKLADFEWVKAIIIAIVIGLIIALIITLVKRSAHKSVARKYEAADYVVPGSMVLTRCDDQFLYVHVDRTPIPKNNNNGGSSTHTTNGHMHGGGGRSF